MARIAGVDLPRKKRMEVALTAIFGIGRTTAKKILESSGIDINRNSDELTDDEITKIRHALDQGVMIEGDLRRQTSLNIKRLIDLGCYRGIRHRRNLPVRGQRTSSNARTRKGKAVAIAGKKSIKQLK